MFSLIGTMPRHRTGAPRRATASMAAMTAAPPDMSSFILSMFSAGLIEMPPVSNVMPLPMSPSVTPAIGFAGWYSRTSSRGGSWLPRVTPSSSPMFSASIRVSSSTSTLSPASCARAAPRSAKSRGVRRLPGSFAIVRAMFEHSPIVRPLATCAA